MAPQSNQARASSSDDPGQNRCFPTTHWSVVLTAGHQSAEGSHQALEALCRAYWYPLYAYVRRRGEAPHDAQDLTQAFFARVLERNYIGQARPERGRFRSFLLAALNHFVADEWDKRQAVKRGGGQQIVSLDVSAAESRFALEPVDANDPHTLYERRWALTVLELAATRLRDEYVLTGKENLFNELRRFETAECNETSSEIAARLGMLDNTFKSHVRRLRIRHRELVREVIAESVETAGDVDDELRHLMRVLCG